MSTGTKVYNMESSNRVPRETGRRIVVADEDRDAVATIVRTLREDGHIVFQAYDVLSAVQLAVELPICDLVISNTKVEGIDGVGLILRLRKDRPGTPIIYLANTGRSTPEVEATLPPDVPIIREPFTAVKLRAVVDAKLNGKADRKQPSG
jgi:two-component system C4-dicarboxylate transport response regulator DctD